MAHNSLAWVLVIPAHRPKDDYEEGLQHARKAVELSPKDANSFNMLALAEYRSGHWSESLAACGRSIDLGKGGNAFDWFFEASAASTAGR